MKKKKIVIMVLILLIVCCMGILFYLLNSISLKTKKLTFEYGSPIQITANQILDTTDSSILSSFEIEEIEKEKGKNYPSAGTYDVKVTYKNGFLKYKNKLQIVVEDTKKPVFTRADKEIYVPLGEKNYAYDKHFKVSDVSDYKLQFQTDEINVSKPGKYSMIVTAVDTSGNKETTTSTVIVQEKKYDSVQMEPTYVNGILIVNKKHPLPKDYAPMENPEAKQQLQKMIQDMQKEGLNVSNHYSGYRSYEYQKNLYESYVNAYGKKEADTFSARAGYSEHQSGLAFDLLSNDGNLIETQPEANWIEENAHLYGFIVRYQKGKEEISGYMAEPWHIRYIGEKATEIWKLNVTLEEYLGVEGGDYEK